MYSGISSMRKTIAPVLDRNRMIEESRTLDPIDKIELIKARYNLKHGHGKKATKKKYKPK